MKRTLQLYSMVAAITPALAVYLVLGPLNLDSILMWPLVFVLLLNRRFSTEQTSKIFFKNLVIISFFCFVTHLVSNWFSISSFVNNWFSILLFAIPIVYYTKLIDAKIFGRTAIILGILASVIVIWQRINLIMYGSFEHDVFLPWFELSRDIDTIGIERPSAFFTEPAHLCIFILPLFYLSLRIKKIFLSGLFGFALLCTGSTTGFLGLEIVFIFHVLTQKGKHKILIILFSLALMAGAVYYILNYYQELILENVNKLDNVGTDSDDRLLGPLKYLKYYNVADWLFGVSLNQLYLLLHEAIHSPLKNDYNYCNSLINSLISYGILGIFAIWRFLYGLWKQNKTTQGFLLVFVLILATDQIYFNAHFFYLVTFVLLSDSIVEIMNENHKFI